MYFSYNFAFTSNADVANGLVFGKDMQTWLIYTLILLGSTLMGYLFVWGLGLLREANSERSTKQPWE